MSEASPDNKEQGEQGVADSAAAASAVVNPEAVLEQKSDGELDSVSDSHSGSVSNVALGVVSDVVPDSAAQSKPEPNPEPKLESKSAPKPASSAAPAKHGNPFVLGLVAVAGAVVVTIITCDIFDQKLPDFLQPFEPSLDKHIRYGLGYGTGAKDWRNELLIEQTIWSSEVNKIRLGQNNAKPEMYKRDYLFYLADSYYRDEPHFVEAKAAYLAGRAEPLVPHKPGYDIGPSELASKIGYSAMRSGSYAEAVKYLKEAIAICDGDKEPSRQMENGGRSNFCLDVLTECEIRQNHLAEAQKIINERLKRIKLPGIEGTVEWYLLFNNAMLQEKLGKYSEAEAYYKKAVVQHEQDDKNRGALPSSSKDNNRMLAYVLREYARFLRTQKRASESYDLMDRAVGIMNNAP